MSKQLEFYNKLKESIDASTKFPSTYLFKFIVPTSKNQLTQVKEVFNISSAVITTKSSKTNKYVSVSISVVMNNSDAIIEKYKEVTGIEGIISL